MTLRGSLLILFVFLLMIARGQIIQHVVYADGDSTRMLEVIHYSAKDSTLHGRYESFHLNGSLKIHGFYKRNLPDSIWTYYYENGQMRAQGRFTAGQTSGKWVYYYENGSKKSEGPLSKEIKQGNWTFYYENGKPKSTGTYQHDQKEGIWNYFYEDGVLKAQAYFERGGGTYKEFYPSGAVRMEGRNQNDKSEGEWRYFHETGEIQARGKFENGLREGDWVYYHKNGKVSAVGTFQNGLETGIWKHFFEDGKLSSEGAMHAGEKDGFWKLYYPSGEVKGEADYLDGDGAYVEYYPSGQTKTKGQIIEGLRQGTWTFYNEEGLVDGVVIYEKGEGEYTGYYADGTVKMTGQLQDEKRVGEWKLYNGDGSLAGIYRPIYEDETPIFRMRAPMDTRVKEAPPEKPDYLYKDKRSRYFTKRINEYHGYIVGIGPLALAFNNFPISIEYYLQERMGFELTYITHRDPFFKPGENLAVGTLFYTGNSIQFRHKLYSKDKKRGMLYFGHQFNYTQINHGARTVNQFAQVETLGLTENRFWYGLIVGNRWMQRPGDSGTTFDFYFGLGAGTRSFRQDFESTPSNNALFADVIKGNAYFPLILGFNIGLAGPKRRTTTSL
jgi:uncharacterized protein